jgi:hypothetical protein
LKIAPAGSGTTTNTWDYENRLTKVQLPSGVVNTFTFSGDGQRLQTQDSSGTLKQIHDGQKVLLETDGTNTTKAVYTSSPGVYGDLVSQKRLLVPHYHVFDPLGSTDRLTSSAQAVTDTYIYKAFGEILLAGSTVNPFRYVGEAGYYFDGDLLCYFATERELDSAAGRWRKRDPLGFDGGRESVPLRGEPPNMPYRPDRTRTHPKRPRILYWAMDKIPARDKGVLRTAELWCHCCRGRSRCVCRTRL